MLAKRQSPFGLRFADATSEPSGLASSKTHGGALGGFSGEDCAECDMLRCNSQTGRIEMPSLTRSPSYTTASVRRQISLIFSDETEAELESMVTPLKDSTDKDENQALVLPGSSGMQSELLTPRVSRASSLTRFNFEERASLEERGFDFDFVGNHNRLAALWQDSSQSEQGLLACS